MTPNPAVVTRRKLLALRVAVPALIVIGVAAYVGYPRWRAERDVDEAVRLADHFEYAAAKARLAAVLAGHTDHARARFQMARVCRRAEDLPAAALYLRDAAKLGWPPAEIELERHLAEAQAAGPQGANERTLKLFVQTNSPDDKLILEAMAIGYRNVHYLEAAVGSYALWIDRYPDDWPPRLGRAAVLEYFEQYPAAEEDYLAVLATNPGNADARRRYGSLLLHQKKDTAAAAPHFAAVLEKDPADREAALGMAECELAAGRPDAARQLTDRVLARVPNDPAANLMRARIEVADGRGAEAGPWVATASRNPPDDPASLYQLSQVCSAAGRPADAARHLARFTELSAGLAEAAALYKRVLREPKAPDLRRQLGDVHRKLGRAEVALPWYFSALAEDPGHAATHRALAEYFDAAGDRQQADVHRRRAGPDK